MPNISIVTVVKGDLAGLRRTSNSVREQEGVSVDWIVIDGGGDEGILRFLHNSQGIQWRSGLDRGIYDAMNIGAALAMAEYVIFLNAGDSLVDKTCLARALEKMISTQVDIMYFGAMFFAGKVQYKRLPRQPQAIWHSVPGNHQATIYRREVLGVAPYDLRYRISGDYFLAARISKEGWRIGVDPMMVANFELGGMSHQNFRRLLSEAARVQRDVLKLSWFVIAISAIRRCISYLAVDWLIRKSR